MAFAIAMSSVEDGAVEVVKGMVDPVALKAMVYTALATCMALLVLPEPTSKALVVAITVGLCTYLGWSTVWGILQGWKRLSAAAKAARTFDELSAAGERFGKLLGANTARVMVMVATTALGSTGGSVWASAGARLPGWGQALQLATAEGLAPALAAPAASVMVVGETLTIGLAAGSNVAMAAQATADNGASSSGIQSSQESQPPEVTEKRLRELGTDPATGQYRAPEAQAGLRLEKQVGPLRRDPSGRSDWIDSKGKTYDAVGPVPPGRFERAPFCRSIDHHLLKQGLDYVVVDTAGLTSAERALIESYIKGLRPEQKVRIVLQ